MKILVIIVTYNGCRWIDKCLSSVMMSSVPVDCIIIDNNSQDETVKRIKDKYGFCKIIESKQKLGFGKANNIGLQYALEHKYDYAYLLNQDAWLFENTISELIRIYEANPEYGIISPLQVNAGLNKLDKNFQKCCNLEMLSDSFCGCLKQIYETNFIMAAHWLIPRKCFEQIGGFSPSFPHYGEDHNYVHRAIYKRMKVGIVPSAYAVHDREFREESKKLKMRKMYLRSIVEISNPNNSLIRNLLLQPFVLLRLSMSMRSLEGIRYVFYLLLKYRMIIRNRNLSTDFSFLMIDK